MAHNSSITGTRNASSVPADTDTRRLGPSNNSDSGSDTLGQRADLARPYDSLAGPALEPLDGGSDASGTGERADVEGGFSDDGADILPDHIIGPGGRRLSPDEVHALSGSLAEIEDESQDEDEDDEDDL